MKDEAGGELILEFVGLKVKAYATWEAKRGEWIIAEKKKLKGIKKVCRKEENPLRTLQKLSAQRCRPLRDHDRVPIQQTCDQHGGTTQKGEVRQ